LRMLELTTYRNWQALSQRLAPLYVEASKLTADSPLRAEAARIRREHATPAERAAAALRLVQDEIRYVLLAMNDGGLNPAPADETWERRFGDCKAKSAMLLALLRELGIEADVAAVSSSFGDGLDARLPGVGVFDHVLVRAQIGGKAYWLDGTRRGDRALSRLQPPPFRWALPLTVRGSDLVAIPLEPLAEPESVVTMQIDAREGITIPAPFNVEMKVVGDAALAMKQSLEGVPEANREEGLRGFWRQQYRGLEIEQTSALFDEAQGIASWTASGTIRMEWDPEYDTYQPHDMTLGYRIDLSRPRGTDANAPYAVPYPAWTRTIEQIRLPADQRESFTVTGTDINTTIAGGEFRRTAKVELSVFTAERNYRSIAPEFAASERAEAERVLLEMSRNSLYLKKPEGYLPTAPELLVEADQSFDEADDYVSLGSAMMLRYLLEQAEVAYSKAIEMEPEHVLARMGRAHVLNLKGDLSVLAADLEAGLAAIPGNAELQSMLANAYGASGRWADVTALLDVMNEAEQGVDVLVRRAYAHGRLGNQELALRDALAAIAIDAKSRPAYVEQAKALKGLDREDEIPSVAEALRAAHGSAPAGLHGAISVALASGDRPLARKYLGEELGRAPSARAYLERARQQDDNSARVADLRMALRQPDASSPMKVEVAKALLEVDLYKEAVDLLTDFEKETVVLFYQLYGLRGVAHWKLGDQAAARRDFATAQEERVSDESFNDLCWDKAAFNVALEEALQECDLRLASTPECAHCLDSRAFVLLRMGRLQEAIQYYDRAIALEPRNAASLYGRGIARIRHGEREAGERDLVTARQRSALVEAMFTQMGVTP
ncbi:MAG TPA: tetratricopeptide repeat protein, partial [Steroidobacteraceae bacterium]|nr:tetratricopeptide repeat protein [Steroidobacteraceae bacterium]